NHRAGADAADSSESENQRYRRRRRQRQRHAGEHRGRLPGRMRRLHHQADRHPDVRRIGPQVPRKWEEHGTVMKPDNNSANGRALSVLVLENYQADFDLITHELRRFGFNADCWRAETEAEFLAGLERRPDIILADFVLTGFDALHALELLKKSG